MTIAKLTRVIYGIFGVLYVVGGIGSMLAPAGWLPQSLLRKSLVQEMQSDFVEHLIQEFGTLLLGVGFTFIYLSTRRRWSAALHWALTAYFALDSLIHWIGPHGPIGSLSRGLINTIPVAVMLVLGLLRRRERNPKGGKCRLTIRCSGPRKIKCSAAGELALWFGKSVPPAC